MTGRRLLSARCLWCVLLVVAMGPMAWADPVAPMPNDRHIAIAVGSLLAKQHLSRHPLDKEMSERCIHAYLKTLDPMKIYFYQSDIDGFMKQREVLSDAIRKGDVSFAFTVFRTFLQRLDERVKTVDELLAIPHDFTADEQILVDRDAMQYAATPAEAYERWRKRIKYDLLVLKVAKIEDAEEKSHKNAKLEGQPETQPEPAKSPEEQDRESREKLARRYHSFSKRMHQINNEELLEMYLNSFTAAFDPHTSYMSPDSQKNFDIAMSLELEGIGASLQGEDGYTVVKKIIPGGAADKDGRLKVEDRIVSVGQGDSGDTVDVVDMKLTDVVKLIRGKRGTIVRLEVMPGGQGDRKVYKMAREKIELTDSAAKGEVFEAGNKPDGTPYRIGVIDLPSFYRDMSGDRRGAADIRSTTTDCCKILEDFNKQHVDAVVLDLRRNGGGALNEAISLTGLFINEGPVVQVKGPDGVATPYNDIDPGIVWSGPLVVLISKFSASASEILAGAVQDYGRGLIVGDNSTHGKGTVQSLLDLGQTLFRLPTSSPSMGALKITMQQFYRPNGDSTQKRGVVADVEWPSLSTHLADVSEADLDYPVEFDHVNPQPHQQFACVTPAIREKLRDLSTQRVQASDDFQRVIRTIARYKEQKAKKQVTLNEAQFLKERAELNADTEEEKAIEKHSELSNGQIERDFYLNEALAIVCDYLNLQTAAQPQTANLGQHN